MNGMLQHHEIYSHQVARHQQEARRWARDGALGALARAARVPSRPHSGQARLLAVVSPLAVGLGVLAILI
jgi:hypothetical protein